MAVRTPSARAAPGSKPWASQARRSPEVEQQRRDEHRGGQPQVLVAQPDQAAEQQPVHARRRLEDVGREDDADRQRRDQHEPGRRVGGHAARAAEPADAAGVDERRREPGQLGCDAGRRGDDQPGERGRSDAVREEREPPQHDPRAEHAGEPGEQQRLDDRALDERRVERHQQVTAPPLSPSTIARVFARIESMYVAPLEPGGPSVSAHSGGRRPRRSRARSPPPPSARPSSRRTRPYAARADRGDQVGDVARRRLALGRLRRDHRADDVEPVAGGVVAERVMGGDELAVSRGSLAMQAAGVAVERRESVDVGRRAVPVQRALERVHGYGSRCAGPATSAGRRRGAPPPARGRRRARRCPSPRSRPRPRRRPRRRSGRSGRRRRARPRRAGGSRSRAGRRSAAAAVRRGHQGRRRCG